MNHLTRRTFLTLSGGALASYVVGGGRSVAAQTRRSTVRSWSSAGTPSAAPTIVLLQLNGGNDGLSTLVPSDGRYYDARPTLAIPASTVVDIGNDRYGLHPALAPLAPLFKAGAMSAIHGIGFPQPDRSHFVSMDRWWRADRMTESFGWLGRWADTLGALPSLGAVGIGGGAVAATGATTTPSIVVSADSFALPAQLDGAALRSMAASGSDDDLYAAVQASFERSASAVEDFASVMDENGDDSAAPPPTDAAGAISEGLRIAGELVSDSPSTRVVVVNAGGFDTHANQLDDHNELYADLANGVTEFVRTVDQRGVTDRVLLVVVSEFGRRVAENASGGTDHGAGGTALVVGSGLSGGVVGDVDWANLIEGDVPPLIDARSLFTDCLTWLGGDPATILGSASPSLNLFR